MAFSLTDPLVQSYIFYSSVLAIKVLFMAAITSKVRVDKKVSLSPEDEKAGFGKVKFDDPDVERTRQAHLNDLENIPAFWILGALYLTTDPIVAWGILLFRVFAISRIMHTVVYAIIPMPQPARAIAWGISYLINIYLGLQVALYYITGM